jgi:hypothetical protein
MPGRVVPCGLAQGVRQVPPAVGCGYETLRLTALVKEDGTHETWLPIPSVSPALRTA